MDYLEPFINRIVKGDCINVMKQLPSQSVDLVLTDPPYIVRYQSRDGRSVPQDDCESWLKPSFAEVGRVLKNNRFCISFYGWTKTDKFLEAWRAAGLRPVGHLVWVKNYHSQERFVRYCHESAYLLAKGGPEKPKMALRDVLDWQYTGDEYHPTQKPVLALVPLILAYSEVGDVVLDPFAGSGTTAVAAKLLSRNYIGIEISEKYHRIAQARVRDTKRDA